MADRARIESMIRPLLTARRRELKASRATTHMATTVLGGLLIASTGCNTNMPHTEDPIPTAVELISWPTEGSEGLQRTIHVLQRLFPDATQVGTSTTVMSVTHATLSDGQVLTSSKFNPVTLDVNVNFATTPCIKVSLVSWIANSGPGEAVFSQHGDDLGTAYVKRSNGTQIIARTDGDEHKCVQSIRAEVRK